MAKRTFFFKNIYVIAEDGVTYSLMGGRPTKFIYLDGVGIPPVERIRQGSPLQDGVVDQGFRYRPRNMTLALLIDAGTEFEADQVREQLTHIFSPTTNPLKLRVWNFDDYIWQIDCYLDGAMDFPQSQRTGGMQRVIAPLYAPDPFWYNPTLSDQTTSLQSGSAQLSISAFAAGSTTVPRYILTAPAWPRFQVTGPVTDLDILHSPVADRITFKSGESIPSGETWEFDLTPGEKSVFRVSDGANRMSSVDTSTLPAFSTMQVLEYKVLQNYSQNHNAFTASGTGTDANSEFRLISKFAALSV